MSTSLLIGLVDLDTSHPGSWIPILQDMGHQVVGVYDGGTVWPAGYADRFANEHAVPRVFHHLADMAQSVDVAIIHSCNWDLHLQRAEPFVRAGKGVLIDKPLVGNWRDAQALLDWASQGHRLYGGSSLRWSSEISRFLLEPEQERGRVHTAFVGCSVDDYNYGIHAYALLSGIMGSGAERVRYLGTATQKLVQVTWQDGKVGVLSIGAQPGYLPFYATVITDRTVRHLEIDTNRIYRALLETALPYLGGTADYPPLPMRELLEPERVALAAKKSWLRHGAEIFLTDLSWEDEGYDGQSFAVEYQRMKLAGTENFRVY